MLTADLFLILAQNVVFSELLGLPSLAETGRRGKGLIRSGVLVLLFCTAGAGALCGLRMLMPSQYERLLFPLCTAVVCGVLDLLAMLLCRILSSRIAAAAAPWIHAAAFSSAVLGTLLHSPDYTHAVSVAFRYGFRLGGGYFLVCVLLRLAAPVLFSEKMPAAVRGWRGIFLYAALLAMAGACMFPS